MPKAFRQRTYKRRSPRTRSHKRKFQLKFTPARLVLAIIFAGIIVILLLTSRPNLASLQSASFSASKEYSVLGDPSISADFINRILESYDSPAAGKGQALYDYGVKYGIDPVYALAFFMHESTFGEQGVATVTHSLGNMRARPGEPEYHGYRLYDTWEEGFEDWYKLIANQYVAQWRLTTVDQIIPIYAPSSDNNDVAAYIRAVETAVNTWRSGLVRVG